MAVSHVTSSQSHASASFSANQASFSWTHTTTTDPQGVLILVFQSTSSTDAVTSVTYDGVTVPAVSGGRAVDTLGEPGSVAAFFLGAGVPTTDNPTVVVNRTNNATQMWAVCSTVTAAANTEVTGTVLTQSDAAIAEQSVDDGSPGSNSVRYAGVFYGGSTPAPAGANSTLLHSNDLGVNGFTAVRETTAGQGSRLVGCTQATSDDRAGVHLAVREVVIPAFTITPRHTGNNGATAATNLTTNSTTPTADSLFIAAYAGEIDAFGTENLPSFAAGPSGGSLSYTLIAKDGDTTPTAHVWGSTNGFWIGGSAFRAAIGGSPSAFAVTVDVNATANAFHSALCFDITGHNATTPIVQSKAVGGTINPESNGPHNVSIVLDAAPADGNLLVLCLFAGADAGGGFSGIEAGSGKTLSAISNPGAGSCQIGAFSRECNGTESATITVSDLGQSVGNWSAVAFEVAAPGGGANINPSSVSAVAAIPSPTKEAGSTVTAVSVGAVASIPAASVGANASVSPASVGAVALVGSPAVQAGAVVAPVSVGADAVIPSPTITAHKYVTGISTNGRYFVDQDDNPILIRGESPWAMFTKLSLSEMDTYLGNRAGYGCNLMLVSMIGAVANGGPADTGATYDGILPFVGGDITNFNSSYWSRMDSFIAKARNLGITLMIYPMDGWNTAFASVVFNPGDVTNADCQTYGQTLATRYAGEPGIIWAFGGDYNEDATINARFNACLTGIRAAGDTRPASIQLLYETSESHNSSFWEPKVDWDWVYTYYVTYKGTSDAYNYTWSASPTIRPALFSEGAYENSGAPHPGTDEVIRRQACWALTSGSPGELTGQEDVWDFQSGWASLLDTTAADQLKAIRDTFEPLDWWTLVPDDSNQLVTAGRGTRITTDSATFPASNNYVTAARAADGTLAVIYLPNAASAITVDMTKIGPNPTATWVDPTTGATTGATPGSSYSRGDNAAADPDWLLILTGDAGVTATPASVTATAGIPSPAVQAGSVVTPAAVQGTAAVPAPTVQAGSVVAPVAVSASAGIPSPTLTSSAAPAPGTVSAVAAVPSAVLAAGSTVTASTVQASAAVPTPAVSAGGSATISPASVSGVASVPAAVMSAGSVVAGTSVAGVADIPAASVSAGSGATVTAVSVAGSATVTGPTVRLGVVVIPAPVAGVAAVSAATLLTSVNVPVFSVAAVATIPTPHLPTIPERDLVLTGSLQRNRFSAGVQPAQRTGVIEW